MCSKRKQLGIHAYVHTLMLITNIYIYMYIKTQSSVDTLMQMNMEK